MSNSLGGAPGRFRIDLIARELEKARNQGPSISFDALSYELYAPVLVTAFAKGRLHSHSAQQHVTGAAITRAAKTPPITEKSLKAAIEAETAEYLARPKQPFVLATTLSLDLQERRVMRFPRSTVTLTPPDLPKSFRKARSILASEAHATSASWDPIPHSVGCRVRVSADQWQEGFELADQQLYFFYGLLAVGWRSSFRRLLSSRTRPLSDLWIGPTQTIHKPSGTLASHTVWMADASQPSSPVRLADGTWSNIAWIRRRLKSHPYRDRCETALSRYARCLTEPDLATAAIQLWSLLETMTGTIKHDHVVKRVAFLFSDSDLHRAVLQHLRENRRLLVHHGANYDSGFQDGVAGDLAGMASTLIRFHLNLGWKLGSFGRACSLLDLPPDPDLLRRALRFLKPAKDVD